MAAIAAALPAPPCVTGSAQPSVMQMQPTMSLLPGFSGSDCLARLSPQRGWGGTATRSGVIAAEEERG